MSSPALPADAKVRAYLQQQLARNPWEESDAIVATRSRALRLETKPTAEGAEDPTDRRLALRNQLDAIRAEAFSGDAGKLCSQLDALPLDDFPDLKAAAARLGVIVASRAKLPSLTQQPDFNADFFNVFKEVLICPVARPPSCARRSSPHSASGSCANRGGR